jgi:putative mRNA 3-end processing factor
MASQQKNRNAFLYRAGVRLAGTVVACDAAAGGDLVFLSHAAVLGARGRRALPHVGGSRRQILATEATLALLGPFGERLRVQTLVVPFGRPFALGDLRLEIFPSGFMPGAASLLCERDGRRLVYSGPVGQGGPVDQGDQVGPAGDGPAELRAADALCIDARFSAREIVFPERSAAEEALRAIACDRSAAGPPLFLIEPPALAPVIARILGAAGVPLRAHRTILDAVAAFRQVDPRSTYPQVQRFAGRLTENEALLWPAEARLPSQGGQVQARPRVLVSPRAGSAAARARWGGAHRLTFPFGADFAQLARYVQATGASEVALVGAPDDELAELLRGRGLSAYRIGPPRQIDLFQAA